MTFRELDLDDRIVRGLEAMGYTTPTAIQGQVARPVLDGRDVIGLAPTGTGKTAAFVAPVMHHLLAEKPTKPVSRGRTAVDPVARLRAIVLCPTRELATQVADEAARVVGGTALRVLGVHGKVAISPQAEAIARGIDLLVSTPGRIRELLDADAVTLAHVRHVTIDEADRMLDMGFLPQVAQILERVGQQRQLLLFTATMPDEVRELAHRFMHNPVSVEVGRHTTTVDHVKQHRLAIEDRDKIPALLHLLANPPRRGVLVFCRTRRRAGWVSAALSRHGFACGLIHGDRTQAQRARALARFASGELDVVVATDVAARGLHVPAVVTVFNYDLPISPEEYVHRVGRAGHGSDFGEAFTFVSTTDAARWAAIVNATGADVPVEPSPIEPRGGRGERGERDEEATRPGRGRARRGRGRSSSRNAPIPKSEKPGRGVRRPEQ